MLINSEILFVHSLHKQWHSKKTEIKANKHDISIFLTLTNKCQRKITFDNLRNYINKQSWKRNIITKQKAIKSSQVILDSKESTCMPLYTHLRTIIQNLLSHL